MNTLDYVKRSEGRRYGLYLDSEGYLTCGDGFKMHDHKFTPDWGEVFNGEGPLTDRVCDLWLQDKLEQCVTRAMDDIGPEAWRAMDEGFRCPRDLADEVAYASPRQAAVLDFIYHNGSMVNFPGLKAAIQEQDWVMAAEQVRWVDPEAEAGGIFTEYYDKHTARAGRNMHILRTGDWCGEEMW